MTENEIETLNSGLPARRLRFDWVIPLLLKPRPTLGQIVQQERAVWLAPLLILSLLALTLVLANGQAASSSAGPPEVKMGPAFEYYTPEQQAQVQQAMSTQRGPLFVYIFPALGALASLWISWFLLGSLLHLALTLGGSRSSNTAALNLAAWAALPLGLRYLVRTVAALATRQVITRPGLSGFVPAEAGGLAALAGGLLALVDLYLLWQVALLLIGVVPMSGLGRGKAWGITLAAVLVVMLLQALPVFVTAQLSGMAYSRPFYFFF